MKSTLISSLILAFAIIGCESKDAGDAKAPAKDEAVGSNPLNAPTDYLGAVAKAKKSAEGTVGLASIGSAIQMFQAENGRNPSSLQELIDSGALAKLPKAPYQTQYSYDPKTGKVDITAAQTQ